MSSAAQFWSEAYKSGWKPSGTPIQRMSSGRPFKKQRTRFGAGGYSVPVSRSLTYDLPSFRRAARFRGGRMSSRYGRRYSSRGRKGLVGPNESGFVDLAVNTYACDTTGAIELLATVPQGTSVNTRVGKKIRWKSIQCRGRYSVNSATIFTDIAMLVVYDKRPTGSMPAITDILVTANPRAFNNDANSGRFRILKRVDFCMTGNSTAPATGNEAFDADFFLDLKGLKGVFKAAGTGQIGDIEEGALYLVTVGDQAAGTGAANLIAGFRVRFQD